MEGSASGKRVGSCGVSELLSMVGWRTSDKSKTVPASVSASKMASGDSGDFAGWKFGCPAWQLVFHNIIRF